MRFVDTTIFIKWGKATLAEALRSEDVSICGYVLAKIRDGEEALTSSLVKDEALIWFSRYKASRLSSFIRGLTALTSISIAYTALEDEAKATELFGEYPLGISDLINLSIMKKHNVYEIYSTDRGFDRVPFVKRVFEELKTEPEYHNFVMKLKRLG